MTEPMTLRQLFRFLVHLAKLPVLLAQLALIVIRQYLNDVRRR